MVTAHDKTEPQREAVVDQVVGHFGQLTILANNAGRGGPKPFDTIPATARGTSDSSAIL